MLHTFFNWRSANKVMLGLCALALAGCVTEQAPVLPMTLGPGETANAACLTYGDMPTFGDDCRTLQNVQSTSQE